MSKFCVNCGAQLEDNAGFCGSCGAKQEVAQQAAAPVPEQPAAAAQPAPVQPQGTEAAASGSDGSPIGAMSEKLSQMSPEQKKKIGIIAGVAAAALAIIIAVIVIVTNLTKYQKIDCQDLYYVAYSGINGQATANVFLATPENIATYDYNGTYEKFKESKYYENYDMEGFYNSIASKWLVSDSKEMKKVWTKFDSKKDMEKAQQKLVEEIEFKIDEEELKNLSNGDTIHVKIKYSEDKLKKKNIKLENTEFTITVEGLLEPEVLDPLSKVKVTFSGNNGRGSYEIDTSALSDVEKDAFYITLTEYHYNDLSNGDTITLKAESYYSKTNGYFVYYGDDKYYTYDDKALTKDVKVEGLKELSTLDPFEGVTLDYSGIAPELRVSVNTENCSQVIRDCISFEVDKSRGVTIGDEITVTATVKSWYEDTLAEYGYGTTLSSTTKTFTVESTAPHYINDIADAGTIDTNTIFENVINRVNESAGSNYLAGNYVLGYGSQIASITGITADDAYLVAPSDIATSSNKLYQIFKVDTVCTIDGASANKTFYLLVEAEQVYVSNGTLAFDDWSLRTWASENKAELVAANIKNDSNMVAGKKITSTAAGEAPAPVEPEPEPEPTPGEEGGTDTPDTPAEPPVEEEPVNDEGGAAA